MVSRFHGRDGTVHHLSLECYKGRLLRPCADSSYASVYTTRIFDTVSRPDILPLL